MLDLNRPKEKCYACKKMTRQTRMFRPYSLDGKRKDNNLIVTCIAHIPYLEELLDQMRREYIPASNMRDNLQVAVGRLRRILDIKGALGRDDLQPESRIKAEARLERVLLEEEMESPVDFVDIENQLEILEGLKDQAGNLYRKQAKEIDWSSMRRDFENRIQGLDIPISTEFLKQACEICEESEQLTKHHIYPKRLKRHCLKIKQKINYRRNLATLCRRCHTNVERKQSALISKRGISEIQVDWAPLYEEVRQQLRDCI